MQRIQLLLILFNIANQGNCSNHQVSVLNYKGGNECENDLVGVPITSISSITSQLEEFTFCGMYNFRYLQNSFLMGIEPSTILRIWDFNNNVGNLFHHGVYYMFDFMNQTVTPDSWQYICVAISPTLIKIAWNGKIILSKTRVDLSKEESTNAKVWLGGAIFFEKEINQRFKGMIAKANFWNNVLKDDEMISITNNGQSAIGATKFDLITKIAHKNSSCIDYLNLDIKDDLFQEEQQHKTILIEYKTDFDSAKYLCQAHGGDMTLPKNDEDMKMLGSHILQSDVCEYPFLRLTKSINDEILDLKGNIMPGLKWGLGQPNGRLSNGIDVQGCIATTSDFSIYDIECNIKRCFFCTLPEKTIFILRGSIPIHAERKYFVATNMKDTAIRGITKTECFWNKRKWNFGKNLKLDNDTNKMPPVGLKTWNNGQKLKFTQCKQDEFTCNTYGHCLPLSERCDGQPDCPVDGSDENECKIMTLDKGYDKRYPSKKNVTVFMSMLVSDILDMNELGMSYTVDFEIQLKWFDPRVVFRNLKPTSYENKLEDSEIGQIWTPKLYLVNSYNDYVEAGQNINNPSRGLVGSVYIHRDGSPQYNELSELNEDYLYPGQENPISMINYITIKLRCKIDLKW